jgi:predicted RNase H-like HicB family nuclease
MTNKYSLIIRWSDEDECFIAWVPELGTGVKAHGATYEEAARMGQEVIESFFQPETARPNETLPEVWKYTDPDADERAGASLFPDNPEYRPVGRPAKQKIA